MEQATLLRTLVVIQTGGKAMMIKTFIVCLISFLLGYVMSGIFIVRYVIHSYKHTKTDKNERILQLFCLAACIAVLITLSMI